MAEQNKSIGTMAGAGLAAGGLIVGGLFGANVGDDNAADNTAVLAAIEALPDTTGLTEAQVTTIVNDAVGGLAVDVNAVDFELDREDAAIAIVIEEIEDNVRDIFHFLNDQDRIEVDDDDDVEILGYRNWDVDINARSDGTVSGQVKVVYLDDKRNDDKTEWIDFEVELDNGEIEDDVEYIDL